MNLGKKIVKIRKDNQLTQDDFAEKYHVTRQTVSSWENSKSYPDLETLVKISDDFKISLDVLLKEDKEMIKGITKSQRDSKLYKRIVIVLGIIIGVIVFAICAYCAMYFGEKYKLEHQFKETIKEYDFAKDNDGYYTLDYREFISYKVPNQDEPVRSAYNFQFFAKPLYCKINFSDDNYLEITWIDYNYYDAELVNKETNEIVLSVGLLGKDNVKQKSKIMEKVDIDEELLSDAIDKGNELYKKFYE